jgi:hypothetical protein
MSRKLLLTLLVLATFTLPSVYALPTDQWLIENAIAGVKAEHPKHIKTEFTGIIDSGWHDHPWIDGAPLHKHVILYATFGYDGTGNVRWEGRSYADGGIYTMFYQNHNSEIPKMSTSVVYLGPKEYWDGTEWVSNDPECIGNPSYTSVNVLVLGTDGSSRTYVLGPERSLLIYPPIGVIITLSILL